MKQAVTLKSRSGQETQGSVEIITWSSQERVKRALKYGGMTWATALVCVLLPIVHFVLVPLFLIAGPFVTYFFYNQKSVVTGGEGTCPYCGQPLVVGRGPDKWPIDELCTKCQNNVLVNKAQ